MDQKYHMSQSNCKQAGECGGTDGIIGEHSVFVIGICFTKGNPPVWLRPFTGGYWPARASLAALLPRWWRIHLQCKRLRFDPWVGKIPWRREWLPIPVFLPGESHGHRSLVGCSPWRRKEVDTTNPLTHYWPIKVAWVTPLNFTKCFHNKCPKKEAENERFRGRGLPKTQTVNARVLDLRNYTWSLCTAWMEINRHVAAAKSLQSCLTVWPHRRQPTRLPCPWDSPGKNTGVGFHFLLQCMKVRSESEVAQSCPTLSHPMDCSLPGSSVYGIFQARVLEWGAIAFSGQTH